MISTPGFLIDTLGAYRQCFNICLHQAIAIGIEIDSILFKQELIVSHRIAFVHFNVVKIKHTRTECTSKLATILPEVQVSKSYVLLQLNFEGLFCSL
jgi:hypothetical protein